jgi:hypothetical protein
VTVFAAWSWLISSNICSGVRGLPFFDERRGVTIMIIMIMMMVMVVVDGD